MKKISKIQINMQGSTPKASELGTLQTRDTMTTQAVSGDRTLKESELGTLQTLDTMTTQAVSGFKIPLTLAKLPNTSLLKRYRFKSVSNTFLFRQSMSYTIMSKLLNLFLTNGKSFSMTMLLIINVYLKQNNFLTPML